MSNPSTIETQMLDLINQERAAAGLAPLKMITLLNESSEEHSEWMLETGVFSHTGEDGSSSTDRIREADYPLTGSWATRENIGWVTENGDGDLSAEVIRLHNNLMDSPPHRMNILDPNVEEIGIGLEIGIFPTDSGPRSVLMVTQNFARTGADTSEFEVSSSPAVDTTEETATEETGAEETATEETGAEETATEETGAEETATEETGAEETGAEETATEDNQPAPVEPAPVEEDAAIPEENAPAVSDDVDASAGFRTITIGGFSFTIPTFGAPNTTTPTNTQFVAEEIETDQSVSDEDSGEELNSSSDAPESDQAPAETQESAAAPQAATDVADTATEPSNGETIMNTTETTDAADTADTGVTTFELGGRTFNFDTTPADDSDASSGSFFNMTTSSSTSSVEVESVASSEDGPSVTVEGEGNFSGGGGATVEDETVEEFASSGSEEAEEEVVEEVAVEETAAEETGSSSNTSTSTSTSSVEVESVASSEDGPSVTVEGEGNFSGGGSATVEDETVEEVASSVSDEAEEVAAEETATEETGSSSNTSTSTSTSSVEVESVASSEDGPSVTVEGEGNFSGGGSATVEDETVEEVASSASDETEEEAVEETVVEETGSTFTFGDFEFDFGPDFTTTTGTTQSRGFVMVSSGNAAEPMIEFFGEGNTSGFGFASSVNGVKSVSFGETSAELDALLQSTMANFSVSTFDDVL